MERNSTILQYTEYMQRPAPEVIIAATINPKPEQHEKEIATILAHYFQCTVEFLQPSRGYKQKTPDIVMCGLMWEIKSPTGSSRKNTIETQFKGLKQSRNLIIDSRRTKLDDEYIVNQIRTESIKHRTEKVLFINKSSVVVDLTDMK